MMYVVEMLVDGIWYQYGKYEDGNKANEVAVYVRDTRDVLTRVLETK